MCVCLCVCVCVCVDDSWSPWCARQLHDDPTDHTSGKTHTYTHTHTTLSHTHTHNSLSHIHTRGGRPVLRVYARSGPDSKGSCVCVCVTQMMQSSAAEAAWMYGTGHPTAAGNGRMMMSTNMMMDPTANPFQVG